MELRAGPGRTPVAGGVGGMARHRKGPKTVEEQGRVNPTELRAILLVGATQKEVAHFFNISLESVKALTNRYPYSELMEKASAERKLSLRRAQTNLAMAG